MSDTATRQPDVLIVGGGTAGCVLAARLSDDPERSVLMLEAGRDLTSLAELPPVLVGHPPASVRELPDTWQYDVDLVDSPRRVMSQFRGRILGGSSSINGSLFVRGIPEDYNAWGSPLWRFDQVLPFFRQLEADLDFGGEFHGNGGPLQVSRACARPLSRSQHQFYEAALAAGVSEKPDVNHPAGDGIGRVPMTVSSRSTALTYLGPCRNRSHLTVLPNSLVTRVVFSGQRAVGVELVRGGQTSVIHAREVILCAGTFASAQLLLLSGVGPAGQLRSLDIRCVADLPGVGQNLRCHPMLTLRVRSSRTWSPDPDTPRLVLVHSATERNNLMIFPRQMEHELAMMVTLRLPSSSGELHLRSVDPWVAPAIHYDYLDQRDLSELREGLSLADDLARRIEGRTRAADLADDWIVEHLETADHACGTCKLGPRDDPLAVVDETCRVHGVEGLRVVDLSIVPRPVRAGPYPSVVMLAKRTADLIDGRRRA